MNLGHKILVLQVMFRGYHVHMSPNILALFMFISCIINTSLYIIKTWRTNNKYDYSQILHNSLTLYDYTSYSLHLLSAACFAILLFSTRVII